MKQSNNHVKFNIRDIVYLKTDTDQLERMITGITIREDGATYELSQGCNCSWHYEFELTMTRDILRATTN